MSAARLLIEVLCSTFDPTISVYKFAINLYPRPGPSEWRYVILSIIFGWNSHGLQSGYGIHGGESRCFVFWQAVAKVFSTSYSYFNLFIDFCCSLSGSAMQSRTDLANAPCSRRITTNVYTIGKRSVVPHTHRSNPS